MTLSDGDGVYREKEREKESQIFSQQWYLNPVNASVSIHATHPFSSHSKTMSQNGSMCVKQPFQRERQGEGTTGGVGKEKNKCHAMQTVKRAQSLQQFYSTSWAELQQLPADKPSMLAAASAALCCPPNSNSFRAPSGCKQMQFCISGSLDITEAEWQHSSFCPMCNKSFTTNLKKEKKKKQKRLIAKFM